MVIHLSGPVIGVAQPRVQLQDVVQKKKEKKKTQLLSSARNSPSHLTGETRQIQKPSRPPFKRTQRAVVKM